MSGLFRKAAIEEQGQRLSGSVCLTQPLSIKLSVAALLLVVISITGFLSSAHYTRKETVSGYLHPNKGMLRIQANRNARVQHLHVGLANTVEKGEVLATLVSAESLNSKIIKELATQITLLESEAGQHERLLANELQHTRQNLKNLASTRANKSRQLLLQEEKRVLLAAQYDQYTKLHERGFMSRLELQQKQHQLLSLKQDMAALENQLLGTQNEQIALEFRRNNLPEQMQLKRHQLENRRSELNRLLNQAQSASRHELLAPMAGQITAVEVVEGARVNVQQTLFRILPADSELVAELLLPTRSAGFVVTGQTARLRFDAFPHQRFGALPGEIFSINTAVLSPRDARLPVAIQEPVYRLQARLNTQNMQAYGSRFALKSGMLLQADIVLETRTLIDWILDPIYSLRGRL